ncbi:MAG: DUF3969 family protein [Oscillospiraceae bacterium]|nr:DUF3969 family protein [Oscillospiraceae bacterium]
MIELIRDDKNEEEKFVLVTIIGLIESIYINSITIIEAEKAIFNPYTVELLKQRGISKDIVSLLIEGCELENIESLMPHKLQKVLLDIKERAVKMLSNLEENQYVEKWFKN